MKMQSESLQGEKKIENNICESVFGTRSRGIRKKPLQNFKGYEDIVRETGCGKNSPKKWCRSMTERLSIKLFGAKAIENDKIGVK